MYLWICRSQTFHPRTSNEIRVNEDNESFATFIFLHTSFIWHKCAEEELLLFVNKYNNQETELLLWSTTGSMIFINQSHRISNPLSNNDFIFARSFYKLLGIVVLRLLYKKHWIFCVNKAGNFAWLKSLDYLNIHSLIIIIAYILFFYYQLVNVFFKIPLFSNNQLQYFQDYLQYFYKQL